MKNLTTFGAALLCGLSGLAIHHTSSKNTPVVEEVTLTPLQQVAQKVVQAQVRPRPPREKPALTASTPAVPEQKLALPEALTSFESLMNERQAEFTVRELKLMDEMLQNLRTAQANPSNHSTK